MKATLVSSPPGAPSRPATGAGASQPDEGEEQEIDLPRLGSRESPGDVEEDIEEIDLPALASDNDDDIEEIDLPGLAPEQQASSEPDEIEEIDLPAIRSGTSAAANDDGAELPALRTQGAIAPPLPAGGGPRSDTTQADLPAPRPPGPPAVPAPPRPAARVSPAASATGRSGAALGLDLASDLPAPQTERAEHPPPPEVTRAEEQNVATLQLDGPPESPVDAEAPPELPAPQFPPERGELDAPPDLPAPKGTAASGFGQIELPTWGAPEATPDTAAQGDFGNIALPEEGGAVPDFGIEEASSSGEAAESYEELRFTDPDAIGLTPPQQAAPPPHAESPFGEADLPQASPEDMEFGIPASTGERASAALPAVEGKARDSRTHPEPEPKKTVGVVLKVGIALVSLALVGSALGLTKYGFFGMYWIEQYLPAAGEPAAMARTLERARELARSDTYAGAREALALLGKARKQAHLNRRLLARSLTHEALYLLRFGNDPASATRAAAIVARLEERSFDAPGVQVALAADAARRNELDEARAHVRKARAASPRDPYVELVAGEIALAQDKPDEAARAFDKAAQLGGGARALWGLARAKLSGEAQDADRRAAVEATLEASPRHAEARVEKARMLLRQDEQETAVKLLREAVGSEQVGGEPLKISKQAKAAGYSLLGQVHEERGRLHRAREQYAAALDADPYYVEALIGAGRVLLRERRGNEAMARFEAARTTAETENPRLINGRRAALEAEFGIARALVTLGRGQQARAKLQELSEAHPEDIEFMLALGEAEEQLEHEDEAERHYRRVIELEPERFDGYLALSQLFVKRGLAERAAEVLNDAASKVEESAHMRRMLGRAELERGQLRSAAQEFRRAVQLDPADLGSLFGLGQTLRKSGQLQEAKKVFSRLESQDPSYAGLALERGLLFESEGAFDKAADSYRQALEADPGNTSLMLRLGAAQLARGDLDAAEQTLAQVRQDMPNSAEAEYFVGRVAFARDRAPEALLHFDRAVALDGEVSEYHLYAGWASLKMGNLGRTLQEVEAAIEHDPSLGDAYWLRGVVRTRTGAVRDALRDLNKALELKPSRHEAYATMGDCYDQMRRLDDAIDAYRRALEHEPDNAHFWYRLGRLQYDAGKRGTSARSLAKAAKLAEAQTPAPSWLPDVYRLQGEAARAAHDRRAATRFYKKYLEAAPEGAIDRKDVERRLRRWGL